MEFSTQIRILLLCSLAVIQINCNQITIKTNGRIETLGSGLYNSFDDVAVFLRKWFSRIRHRMGHVLSDDLKGERLRLRRSVSKRNIEPPASFEDIERKFLLSLGQKHLEQLFGYMQYINKDNETRTTEIDNLMQEEIARLQQMTLDQLKVYCAKLQAAMKNGISVNQEITVGGRTYSLDSIAHVCCPWG